jgi:hypothetical protein
MHVMGIANRGKVIRERRDAGAVARLRPGAEADRRRHLPLQTPCHSSADAAKKPAALVLSGKKRRLTSATRGGRQKRGEAIRSTQPDRWSEIAHPD